MRPPARSTESQLWLVDGNGGVAAWAPAARRVACTREQAMNVLAKITVITA